MKRRGKKLQIKVDLEGDYKKEFERFRKEIQKELGYPPANAEVIRRFIIERKKRKDEQALEDIRCRIEKTEKETGSIRKMILKIREELIRHRAITDLSFDGIMVMEGRRRTIVFTNQQMAEMLGYTVGELTGLSYIDLLPPDDREAYMKMVEERLKQEKPRTLKRRLIRKEGTVATFTVSASNLNPNDKTVSAASLAVYTKS